MKTIKLENKTNQLHISQLAVGHLNRHVKGKTQTAFSYMEEFLELGGTTFDSARNTADGQSEIYLGKFLKETGKRKDMILTTKCGHHNTKTYQPRVDQSSIVTDVETSLTSMGTDYIDILYLHRDDISRPVEEIMVILDKLVKSGKVRVLGASNWTATRLEKANGFAEEYGLTPFSISQINYSLGLTTGVVHGDVTQVTMNTGEKSWYEKSKLALMPYSPNARGFFSQVVEQGQGKPRTQELYGWCPENYKRADRVKLLAEKYDKPVGTVVLSYLLSQELDICPIISFTSKEQFAESKLALDFTLSPSEVAFLEGITLI